MDAWTFSWSPAPISVQSSWNLVNRYFFQFCTFLSAGSIKLLCSLTLQLHFNPSTPSIDISLIILLSLFPGQYLPSILHIPYTYTLAYSLPFSLLPFSDYYVASCATPLSIYSRYLVSYFTLYFTLYFIFYPIPSSRPYFTPSPIPYPLHHVELGLYNLFSEVLNKDCTYLTERN